MDKKEGIKMFALTMAITTKLWLEANTPYLYYDSVNAMSEKIKKICTGNCEEIIGVWYLPCGRC